jgi:hypothetical protein
LEVHKEAERRAEELASEVVYLGGRSLVAGENPDAAEILRDGTLIAWAKMAGMPSKVAPRHFDRRRKPQTP